MISGRGFLIGATQWLNATLGGDPDQPFSTRAATEADNGHRGWMIVEASIDLLFAFAGERDHCRNSQRGPNA